MPVKPGLSCGKLSQNSRCEPCRLAYQRARENRRGTITERGLGWEHQKARKAILDKVGPITACPHCDAPIDASNPITGEHGIPRVDGGTEVTELICRLCNSASGGRTRRKQGMTRH